MPFFIVAGVAGYMAYKKYYENNGSEEEFDTIPTKIDPSIKLANKTFVELLVGELKLDIIETPISTITFFEGASVETIHPYLQKRVADIVKANPFLGGWLIRDKRLKRGGDIKLIYDESGEDICKGIYTKFDIGNDDVTLSYPGNNYKEYVQLLLEGDCRRGKIKVHRNTDIVNRNDRPLFKVTLIPDYDSPTTKFALIMSMSHMCGDTSTFYQIYSMLSTNTTTDSIKALNPNRKHEFTKAIKEKRGAEEAQYLRSVMTSAVPNFWKKKWGITGKPKVDNKSLLPKTNDESTESISKNSSSSHSNDDSNGNANNTSIANEPEQDNATTTPLSSPDNISPSKPKSIAERQAMQRAHQLEFLRNKGLLKEDDSCRPNNRCMEKKHQPDAKIHATGSSRENENLASENQEYGNRGKEDAANEGLCTTKDESITDCKQKNVSNGNDVNDNKINNANNNRSDTDSDPVQNCIFFISDEWIQREKKTHALDSANHDESIEMIHGSCSSASISSQEEFSFCSTNSIITSWFFNILKPTIGFVTYDYRNKLVDYNCDLAMSDAGNYQSPIPLHAKIYKTPQLIEQSIGEKKIYRTTSVNHNSTKSTNGSGKFPVLPDNDITFSVSTDWSSFLWNELHFDLQATNVAQHNKEEDQNTKYCEEQQEREQQKLEEAPPKINEVLHLPLYDGLDLSHIPNELSLCTIFSASPGDAATTVAGEDSITSNKEQQNRQRSRRRLGALVVARKSTMENIIIKSSIVDEIIAKF